MATTHARGKLQSRRRRSAIVHLVDASPYIFRAYFAMPEILAPDGSPVEAVYGFTSFLLRLLNEERPTHLGVAFDKSLASNFRNRLYPDYKANREKAPPELKFQLRRCEHIARVLGAAVYSHRRFEADDVIATLTEQLGGRGRRFVVVTSDKDLAQLVDGRVHVLDFARGERWTPSEVRRKFGVAPRQIPELLGLAGDPVDNIPGVPGVGPKTAIFLLHEFGSLDRMYANLERVRRLPIRGADALVKRLEKGREGAFLSRELALVARNAPISADIGDLRYRGILRARAGGYLRRLGFDRLRTRVLSSSV